MVRAGLKAIYLSGWQVAADANTAGAMYPDQSLYPANSRAERGAADQQRAAPRRPDRACRKARATARYWFAPIVADAEAGFGGPLNAFELMKAMIEAGAAGVHFEDQLASEKKCGHLGGKVLVPTAPAHPQPQRRAARRRRRGRADRAAVPHRCRERQAAHQRRRRARPPVHRRRPHAGGLLPHQARAAASTTPSPAAWPIAPYADLLWWETSDPDLDEARAVRRGDPPANSRASCWPTTARPSFNWKQQARRRGDRQVPARARAPWATSSSSSPWPASTA